MILSYNFSRAQMITKLYVVLCTIFFSLIALIPAQAHSYKASTLEIMHPWSRATMPKAKVAGGYLKIINHGDKADRLIKITTPLSDDAQIHEMAVIDGAMKMRHLSDGIAIPAGGTLEFKPGSYHIMFMDLKNGLKQGEKFSGTLFFEKAGKVTVDFAVEAMTKKTMSDDKHMQHSDKDKPAESHQH